MDKLKITILVVLYNKTIETSETLQSILDWDKVSRSLISKLIIWDNSKKLLSATILEEFKNTSQIPDIQYIGDGENKPLSKIYNTVIRKAEDTDILSIWDHDSNIPNDYLTKLCSAVSKYPKINLFLPKIYFDDSLVSPAKLYYFIGKRIETINSDILEAKHTTAINSGMSIRVNYLKSEFPGYNEKIKFYGTDNDFMYKYSLENDSICIIDSNIKHTLNYYDNPSIDNILWRFNDMKNGMFQQMKSINPCIYIFSKIYMVYYGIKMSFKYRTVRFLKNSF